jgi:hypothetical protein
MMRAVKDTVPFREAGVGSALADAVCGDFEEQRPLKRTLRSATFLASGYSLIDVARRTRLKRRVTLAKVLEERELWEKGPRKSQN